MQTEMNEPTDLNIDQQPTNLSQAEESASSPASRARPTSSLPSSLPLCGERVVFTGTLASMTHQEAMTVTEQYGGTATQHPSRQTTMLVIGEEGWPLEENGTPSQKLQIVQEWNEAGADIHILNESDWLYLLGYTRKQEEVHRLYTPAMLSKMLDVPLRIIRGWERAGLIQAVKKVHRLSYFDFQEVSSARKLVELISAGVSTTELEQSLYLLRKLMPGASQPLVQLEILARDSHLLYRDRHGPIEPKTGQRQFDFESLEESSFCSQKSRHATEVKLQTSSEEKRKPFRLTKVFQESPFSRESFPPDWFEEGCRYLEENSLEAAVEAFRLFLMDSPGDPVANFYLGEALYRQEQISAALERFYVAVECDHEYLEAWTQVGCLQLELGEKEVALDAFQIGLTIHSDYPDAHWHIAEILRQMGDIESAIEHWNAYLKYDQRGPWADTARQWLEKYRTGNDSEALKERAESSQL